MKLTPAFFHEKPTRQLLERASAVLGVPLSIHGNNDWHITGWGGCAACAWVNKQEKGKKYCRASRQEFKDVVKQQNSPVTFVCHMGCTCVIAAVTLDDNYILTLGPYIPDTDTTKTKSTVEKSLAALNKSHQDGSGLPFTLDDIRTVPQGSIRAGAEWILEGLRALLNDPSRDDALDSEADLISQDSEPVPSPKRAKGRRPAGATVEVSIMALSLLCGRTKECRAFMADLLDEYKRHPEQIKPGLIRVVSELLDAVKRQGGDIQQAWETYAAFVDAANTLNTPEELLKAAEKVLRRVARTCSADFMDRYVYMPAVVTVLQKEYAREKLLTETAKSTGVALSTITRSLEHKTGANFSEVLGRIRILHARRLLRTTTLPATSIAKLVGIHDQANFGKLFKRYCRDTPGAYRARFRK